jgi:type II secretory pathway pseudopilin PulG
MRVYLLNRFQRRKFSSEAGFTIVEFIIASVVFSVILLLITSGIIELSRSYFKGVVSSRTQDTARNIVDAISQPLQFNGDNFQALMTQTYAGVKVNGFCIGTKRFSYILADATNPSTQSTINNNILVEDDVSLPPTSLIRCVSSTPPLNITGTNPPMSSGPYIELMSADMWLDRLQVCQVGNSSLYDVYVRVLYGPFTNSLFTRDINSTNQLAASPSLSGCGTLPVELYQCVGDATGLLGSEFCATSEFDTVVTQRVEPAQN